MTTSRLTERNSSGLLVRAAWANSGGSSEPAERPASPRSPAPPISSVAEQPLEPPPALRRQRAEQRRGSAPAPDPRTAASRRPRGRPGSCVPTIGSTSAVDDMASARPSAIAPARLCPSRYSADADQQRADRAARPRRPRTPAARIAHKPPEAKLEPDREQQQDDAELGERLDRLGVGDGERSSATGCVARQRAEPGRPDQHADQDEADHRADPEAGEGRDDDPGRAEDHQRVAEARTSMKSPAMARFKQACAPCHRGASAVGVTS